VIPQVQSLDPHEIYYGIDGERHGPVDLERVRQLVEHGTLRAHDYIWLSAEERWLEAKDVPEIARLFQLEQLIAGPPSPGSSSEAECAYAGFWIRLAAHLIDGMVLLLPCLFWFTAAMGITGIDPDLVNNEQFRLDPLSAANSGLRDQLLRFELLAWAGFWVIELFYRTSLESSAWQATVGKRVFGLIVVDARGDRLSLQRAAFRQVCKLLSQIPFNFGFVVIAIHAKKQGLHDMIAKTFVVRK